ncbi:MAG: hypothetical protein Ta2E_10720 [Mycoplasmoidaceae bacterium]|nr:MAG: hypothetical protein Ta2E_10720 [Mycoplasmoidaceae bacterium]
MNRCYCDIIDRKIEEHYISFDPIIQENGYSTLLRW